MHSIPKATPIFVMVLVLLTTTTRPAYPVNWQQKHNDYQSVRQQFRQPPLWYAPHTFWFWDAPLDTSLTASMAREMTKQRLNPGYVHARHSGAPESSYPKLPVEQWLSPLWFQCFDAALTEAEKAGMTLGYCDEYWWPSGQAAGRVLKAHPELAAQSLQWQRIEVTGPGQVPVPASAFAVAGRLDASAHIVAKTLTLIGKGEAFHWQVPAGKWVIYAYNIYHHPGIDGGKVNYLNPALMDVFIQIAHQPYADYFDGRMGASIPGVFVDNEGDFGWKMAWSDHLARRYQQLKGRDIRLWLPLLTEQDDEGLWAKARYDWFDVVSDVYTENFLGRVNDWLARRGMYYISNLWEESLILQSRAVGDFMRAQRRVSLPGNDCLQMKSQQVHDFKETQSVCEFEDRPFMSELMGVAGWEQTPVQMKMTLNAVTAWGVTHTVPHGINLNRNLETIPYPADWFTENPYWRYLHLWADFARRASYINRQGRLVADVLLLNPLESVWALSEGYFTSPQGDDWDAKAYKINERYSKAMDVLTHAHLDYLIADSYYMKKASLQTSNDRPHIVIQQHPFSAIVLPPMLLISRKVADKLVSFAEAGGTVVCLGDLPVGSPEKGARDNTITEQMQHLLSLSSTIDLRHAEDRFDQLPRRLATAIGQQVHIQAGNSTLLVTHRRIGEADFYWIANNTDQSGSSRIWFRDGSGRAEKWDCESGEVRSIYYEKSNSGNVLDLDIKPYEAFWLVFDPDKSPIEEKTFKPMNTDTIRLTGPWALSLPETHIVRVASVKSHLAEDAIKEVAVIQPDYDDSDWPWQNIVGSIRIQDVWKAPLIYIPDSFCRRYFRYTFSLPEPPAGGFINVNADNSLKLWINGKPLPQGKHADSWIKGDIYDVHPYLHKGRNLIAAEVTNNAGFGWLIVQGEVTLPSGKNLSIVSGPAWKQSKKADPGWYIPGFHDERWEPVQIASREFARGEFRKMHQPEKLLNGQHSLWWRFDVPPGAQTLRLPGLSPSAAVRVDGQEVKRNGESIKLVPGARVVVVKTLLKDNGLAGAAEFSCAGHSQRHLDSWLRYGLHQFTGFVDYEKSFTLDGSVTRILVDIGRVLHTAEVQVNGKKVGERLWPPFVFDVTGACRPGRNTIRIRIGNLMANRMWLSDDLGTLRHWGWHGKPPLRAFDAGLFGPVRIVVER